MIITFCGHSQYTETKQDEEKIISFLSQTVGDRPAELFLGGYGSFDAFALKCGKKYQKTHPNTKLIFVTPYISANVRKDVYDGIIYPSLEKSPPKFAISHRNKWMVEQADFVIAYIDHSWGGAYQTYKHAKRKSKPLLNLTGKEF